MRRSRRCFAELPSIARLWTFRILIDLQGHRHFIRTHDFSYDDLARVLQAECAIKAASRSPIGLVH